jgi:SOS-response transcriptional repressor LexA
MYKCKKCGHEWAPRLKTIHLPVICPRCKRDNWRGASPALPVFEHIPTGEVAPKAKGVPTMYVGNALLWEPGDYLLHVSGEEGGELHDLHEIHDGDYLLLRPQTEAFSGEITTVLLDGQPLLRRLYFQGEDTVLLRPVNSTQDQRQVPRQSVTVLGVYRGLIRPEVQPEPGLN